jgi:uncharacterized protein YkwD
MLALLAMLSTAAVILFADAANQPVSLTTVPDRPEIKKLDLNTIEQGIIAGTNAQRARYGLPALVIDPTLQQQARGQAAWMTNHRSLQHTTAAVGENIGMGQNSAEEVVNAWMNSSGHRANILNGGYHKIGAAAYTAPNGSIYWCEQFVP